MRRYFKFFLILILVIILILSTSCTTRFNIRPKESITDSTSTIETSGILSVEEFSIQLVQQSLTKELPKEKNKWKAVKYVGLDYVVNFNDSAYWYVEKDTVYNLNDMAATYAGNNKRYYGIEWEKLFDNKTEATTTTTTQTTTTATETTTAPKEAITIKLEICEGPTYSSADNVCYYRIKANVTGNPIPTVVFSKDDSDGVWGANRAQINLHTGESYNLTAVAKSSDGTASDSILLTWGCDETTETTETTTQTTIEQSKDPKIVGGEAFYNLIAQALNILAQKDPEVYKQYASVDKIEERSLDLGWGGMTVGTSVYIDLANLRNVIPQVAIIDGIAITLSHEFNHVVNRYFNGKIAQVEFEKIAMMQQLNTANNIDAPDFLVFWIQDQIINLSDPQTWWWKH